MKWFVSVTALIFTLFMCPFGLIGGEEMYCIPNAQSVENLGEYSCSVMKNDTGGWYYQVESNKKTIIIQKSIPAINGNIAFADSLQASLIANLVIHKLESGNFLPSIKLEEIDSLHIYF